MATSKSKRTKSIDEALDQSYRIQDELKRRGQEGRWGITNGSFRKVGTVIGNMADRLSMKGIDFTSPKGMATQFSYEDRTTDVGDDAYNRAIKRLEKSKKYRAQRQAQGLNAG